MNIIDSDLWFTSATDFRPRSHGNAIVPFHHRSSFWNAKIDCSHGNGTIAYQFLFLFTRERNRSVPQFFLQSLPFFSVTTTSTHALRETNLIVPFFGPVLTSLPVHTGTERNETIAYRSTFHITFFIVPLFGTERCYFKCSRVNPTPERSTFRNGTIWNGTLRSRVNGALYDSRLRQQSCTLPTLLF